MEPLVKPDTLVRLVIPAPLVCWVYKVYRVRLVQLVRPVRPVRLGRLVRPVRLDQLAQPVPLALQVPLALRARLDKLVQLASKVIQEIPETLEEQAPLVKLERLAPPDQLVPRVPLVRVEPLV